MTRIQRKPLTIPSAISTKQGVEWLSFSYTNKGQTALFDIRTDIESVKEQDLSPEFKLCQSIYPRALNQAQYVGNRWHYEHQVNEIGWRLCWLNPEILSNKRGLLQRAVDSFRNLFPDLKSRRVQKLEKTLVSVKDSSDIVKVINEAPGTSLDPLNPLKPLKSKEPKVKHRVKVEKVEKESLEDDKPITTRTRAHDTKEHAADEPIQVEQKGEKHAFEEESTSRRVRGVKVPSNDQPKQSKNQTFTFQFPWNTDSIPVTIQTNLSDIPVHSVTEKFKTKYMIFGASDPPDSEINFHTTPNASQDEQSRLLHVQSKLLTTRWTQKLLYNTLAWQFAYLNPETLGDRPTLLQMAVDAYVEKTFDRDMWPRPAKRAIERAERDQLLDNDS